MALSTSGLTAQNPPPGLSKNDREVVLTILRQVQDDVTRYYYDPAFHGIDLKAWFGAAESRLQAVGSFNEAMAILTASLAQLDDSHTALYPPNRATSVDYGWRMAAVGDQMLVVDVSAGSDAAAQGVAPGDQVLSLNRFVPTRDNLWQILHLYRFVRPQAQQHLVIRKPDGTERALDIRSKVTTRRLTELADLIAEIEETERQRRDRVATVGDNIFVWKMNGFGPLDAVQEATKRARKHKAFVIDLRGNGGGAVDALTELVSRTFDHDLE